MATFAASLVTPERILLEEEVQAVFLRTDVGDSAFMPGHTPLIGALVPGLVRFQLEDGTEERAAVHGGFVQVENDHVTRPRTRRRAGRGHRRRPGPAGPGRRRAGGGRGHRTRRRRRRGRPAPTGAGRSAGALRRAEVRLEVATDS